jgi:excisionase family DNA binding protein
LLIDRQPGWQAIIMSNHVDAGMPGKSSAKGKLAYRPREFCEAVGIGQSKFYGLVREGRLRVTKLGKATIVLDEDARAFMRSLRGSGGAE